MNRDETIALFERCEAARAEARDKALAEGKSEAKAYGIGHEAAKAQWNGWAEPLLAERKAMEADGRWGAEKNVFGTLLPQNGETRDWMARASADFTRARFETQPSLRGADAPKQSSDYHDTELDRHGADAPRDDEGGAPPVKSISIEDNSVNFFGFKFPRRRRLRQRGIYRPRLLHRRGIYRPRRLRQRGLFRPRRLRQRGLFRDQPL